MPLPLDDLINANKRAASRVLGVVAGTFVLLALLALALRVPWIFPVMLLVLGAGATAGLYLGGDRVALSQSGAHLADKNSHARLHNITEGLCIAHGLPEPALYVIDDRAANAFAVGRDPKHASVVVTSGLLEVLGPIELEGVLAQELSHIKCFDTFTSTIACIAFPAAAMLASEREVLADQAAVEMTRYPPGLISALEKMRDRGTYVQRNSRFIAHLWMEAPSESDTGRGDSHLTIDERIATLREL